MRQVLRYVAALREHRPRPQAAGAVARAHQGTGEHPEEAELFVLLLDLDELLRPNPTRDRQVPGRGAQVLSHRDDVAGRVGQPARGVTVLAPLPVQPLDYGSRCDESSRCWL